MVLVLHEDIYNIYIDILHDDIYKKEKLMIKKGRSKNILTIGSEMFSKCHHVT